MYAFVCLTMTEAERASCRQCREWKSLQPSVPAQVSVSCLIVSEWVISALSPFVWSYFQDDWKSSWLQHSITLSKHIFVLIWRKQAAIYHTLVNKDFKSDLFINVELYRPDNDWRYRICHHAELVELCASLWFKNNLAFLHIIYTAGVQQECQSASVYRVYTGKSITWSFLWVCVWIQLERIPPDSHYIMLHKYSNILCVCVCVCTCAWAAT